MGCPEPEGLGESPMGLEEVLCSPEVSGPTELWAVGRVSHPRPSIITFQQRSVALGGETIVKFYVTAHSVSLGSPTPAGHYNTDED